MVDWVVDIYYSGYVTNIIEAEDEEEAIIKGRVEAREELRYNQRAFLSELSETLGPWEEEDTAERL